MDGHIKKTYFILNILIQMNFNCHLIKLRPLHPNLSLLYTMTHDQGFEIWHGFLLIMVFEPLTMIMIKSWIKFHVITSHMCKIALSWHKYKWFGQTNPYTCFLLDAQTLASKKPMYRLVCPNQYKVARSASSPSGNQHLAPLMSKWVNTTPCFHCARALVSP